MANGLDLRDEIHFQLKEWKTQKIGWTILSIFLFLTAFGLFGHGPLSDTVTTSENLRIEYEKFGRFESQQKIKLQSQNESNQAFEIEISNQLLENVEIQSLTPQPTHSELVETGQRYRFGLNSLKSGMIVSVHYKPKKIGRIKGHIGLTQDSKIMFEQFIYP